MFLLGHQLVHQTYIIHSYNYKDKIKNYENTPKLIPIDSLWIPTHVHSNSNCDKLIPYL